MPVEVVMPRLSDTMEEGKILKWFKHEGERVEKGEPLLEVETDKANMEMQSYESGVLQSILVEEGESATVGAPIAVIDAAAKAAATPAPAARKAEARAPAPSPSAAVATPERPRTEGEERIKASPLAKRIAEERGIELSAVSGTGPAGRITEKDVEAYLQRSQPARTEAARPSAAPAARPARPPAALPEEVEMVSLSKMQQTIARRMADIVATVPHFYVTGEVDMTEAVKVRHFMNEAVRDTKISFNDIVIKAVALALKKFPNLNSFYRDGEFERHPWINIGIAVSVEEGLLVPVLRDVDKKDLRTIAVEAAQLVERTRTENVLPNDLEGGTFTVSNLGMFDVEEFSAIINTPQSGILAVGAIKRKPVVVDDDLEIRDRMKMTLSCDHRVVYGAEAAQFLQEVKRVLENPLHLVV